MFVWIRSYQRRRGRLRGRRTNVGGARVFRELEVERTHGINRVVDGGKLEAQNNTHVGPCELLQAITREDTGQMSSVNMAKVSCYGGTTGGGSGAPCVDRVYTPRNFIGELCGGEGQHRPERWYYICPCRSLVPLLRMKASCPSCSS